MALNKYERLRELEARDAKAKADLEKFKKLSHVKQVCSDPVRLKRMEIWFREAFAKRIRKNHKHLIPEEKEIFAMFMTEWMDEKVKSLNEFLYEGNPFERNLKKIWKNQQLK